MSAYLPRCVEEAESLEIEENVVERCRPHEILSDGTVMLRTRVIDRSCSPRPSRSFDQQSGVRRITRESVMYAKSKAKKIGIVFHNVAEKSSIEGTSYLLGTSIVSKLLWLALLCTFMSLTTYQVYQQVRHYLDTPISTNIIAEYPADIVFPAIAICNNNQFRLTKIASKEMADELHDANNESISIYDHVLRKRSLDDAFEFLIETTHQKEKMILACRWPDGSSCGPEDFEVLWTYTGICYTINNNASTAKRASRSGINNALELLLNVENYEAIRDCSPFQRTNLPGFHILIYEQHDVPASRRNGISIPTGFSVGIPMKPQHKTKIPVNEGGSCRSTGDVPQAVNTCVLDRAIESLEVECQCSLDRRISDRRNTSIPRRPACNVRDLVECINPTTEKMVEIGCPERCVEVEYLAWQMIALLPEKIFAPIAKHTHSLHTTLFDDGCTRSHLTRQQTESVITDVLHASEVDTRNNRLVRDKTKQFIAHMRRATQKLIDLKWGPTQALYQPAFKRLFEEVDCYRDMRLQHQDMAYSMESDAGFLKPSAVEEILEKDPSKRVATNETSLEELQSIYGSRFKKVFLIIDQWYDTLDHFWAMYKKEGHFSSRLQQDLHIFWKIMNYVNMFENGNITRYQWATFMDQHKLKSFYTKLFPEVWYEPTFQDFNDKLVRVINQLYDEELDIIDRLINDTEALEAGASALLYSPSEKNVELFKKFVVDLRNCTFGELKTKATAILQQLNEAFSDFNQAYSVLFLDDLPKYLAHFDWERRIAPENFANVKVFFYKMSIEHSVQSRTYSKWSLACDVGGTMGLFLGCSILTLIELVYLFAYECFGWRSSVRTYHREKRSRRPRTSSPSFVDERQPFAVISPPSVSVEYRKRPANKKTDQGH